MATAVGKLFATLGLDSAQYEKGLKRAKKSVNQYARQTKKDFKSARRQINKLGNEMKLYAAVAAGGLAVVVSRSIEAASATADAADKLGLTTEALGGLRHMAEQYGVAGDTMTMGLQRMTRRLAEAAQGGGEAVGALDDLNLSAKDLAELSPDQQFKKITEAMGGVSSQSEKVRLAFKLFDSEGVALINTMKDGVAGIEAMEQQALDLGVALNSTDSEKLRMAGDAADRATKVFAGLANKIALELSPYIVALADYLVDAAVAGKGFGDKVGGAMEYVAGAVGVVTKAYHGWRLIIAGVKAFANKMIADMVSGLGWIGKAIVKLADKAGVDLSGMLGPLDTAAQSTQELWVASRDEFAKLARTDVSSNITRQLVDIKTAYDKNVKAIVAGQKKVEDAGEDTGKGLTTAEQKKNDAILKGNEKLDDELMKLSMDRHDYAMLQAADKLKADIAAGYDSIKAYKLYAARMKQIDKSIATDHKAAFDATVDQFANMMGVITDIGVDKWQAIGETIKSSIEDLDIDYSKVFGGLSAKKIGDGMSAAAGVYSAGMAGQQQTKAGDRTGGIIAGAVGGAAAGAQVGSGWGAAAGAVAGGALASSAPDPDTGAKYEHGLGKLDQLAQNTTQSIKSYAAMFSEAFAENRVDVIRKITEQLAELGDGFLDITRMSGEMKTEWLDLIHGAGGDLLNTIIATGLDSSATASKMQDLAGSATDLALQFAATGQAGDVWAQTAVDIAVALNQDSVALTKNLQGYSQMIDALAAVDERTRGLENASTALALTQKITARATMFGVEAVQAASAAGKELTDIQTQQRDIATQLANAHNLTADEVGGLIARQAELNDRATEIEKGMTGMIEGASESAESLGDAGDASKEAGDKMRTASDGFATAGDKASVSATQMDILKKSTERIIQPTDDATESVRRLSDALVALPTGEIKVKWSMSGDRAPGKAVGEGFIHGNNVPRRLHHGERILTAAENRRYSAGDPGGSAGAINVGSIIVNAAPGQDTKEIARKVRDELVRMSQRGQTVIDSRGVGVGVTG